MSFSGAYEDEMGRFLGLSDEQLSRLLAGEAGVRDEAFDEVASLLRDVRATYATTAPADDARAAHLAALAEASRVTVDTHEAFGPPTWRRVMKRTRGLALKAAAGTVAASMSLIGLAYAGVDLPGEAAAKALEAVTGLELPNQHDPVVQDSHDGKSVSDAVHEVQDGDLEGCERGQAIADAADANRSDEPKTKDNPCDNGGGEDTEGSSATGAEKSAAAKARAAEKKAAADAKKAEQQAEAEATAEEKSGGSAGGDGSGRSSDAGADNAGTNNDRGEQTSSSATAKGGQEE